MVYIIDHKNDKGICVYFSEDCDHLDKFYRQNAHKCDSIDETKNEVDIFLERVKGFLVFQ